MSQYLDQAGKFECIVEQPEAGWLGEAGERATPFIRIPVKVVEGDDTGKTIVYQAWLSDAAFDKTIARLAEVFGFDGDIEGLVAGRQTLAGLPCQIETEFETYENKPRLRVKWLNKAGGGIKPLEAAKVSSLLGKLNARSKAVAKQALKETGAAKPAAKPAQSEGGDDMPF